MYINNVSLCSLQHHGIRGMHWGIRRYQPYPSDYHGDGIFKGKNRRKIAKEATKMLEKNQMATAKNMYEKHKLEKKLNKATYKYSSNPTDKNAERVRTIERRQKDTDKMIKQGEEKTQKILNNLANNDYGIYGQLKIYDPNRGKRLAAALLGLGVLVDPTAFAGVKYKVTASDGLDLKRNGKK